jgi:hypothetical protein
MRLTFLASAAVAAAFLVAPAYGQDLVFMLDNQSSGAVQEFYASPVGVDNWEEDILGTDILAAGEASRITIADARDVCEYDLKIVFDDATELEERNINLCDTGSYTVSD